MKKSFVVIAAVLIAFALAPLAFAATDQPKADRPATLNVTPSTRVIGQIVSVDSDAKILIVESQGLDMAFRVPDELASNLRNMAAGNKVTIDYTIDAGQMLAQDIRALPQSSERK